MVTTEGVGFGAFVGRAQEGVGGCAERVKRSDKREAKTRLVWNGQRRQGDPREGDEGKGRNGNDERMQVLKHDGNGVPMQCE